MAGLVGYASSDEEDEVENVQAPETQPSVQQTKADAPQKPPVADTVPRDAANNTAKPAVGPQTQSDAPLGPSLPPQGASYPEPSPEPAVNIDISQAPGSPYTTTRNIIHDLTLPTVPDLDVPPSPPGSPPPGLNKKFEQFLALKKQGVHFNAKLENSAALKNPSVMDTLMGFVGIDGKTQYETTVAKDIWDPTSFPDSVYKTGLRRSQERLEKGKEGSKSGFVSGGTLNTTSTVDNKSRGEKRKSGWDQR